MLTDYQCRSAIAAAFIASGMTAKDACERFKISYTTLHRNGFRAGGYRHTEERDAINAAMAQNMRCYMPLDAGITHWKFGKADK
jgi:hypothetical protein